MSIVKRLSSTTNCGAAAASFRKVMNAERSVCIPTRSMGMR
ncbi:MAG: hypothetical protein ACM3U1_08880 [Chloroflexota bacterium]